MINDLIYITAMFVLYLILRNLNFAKYVDPKKNGFEMDVIASLLFTVFAYIIFKCLENAANCVEKFKMIFENEEKNKNKL